MIHQKRAIGLLAVMLTALLLLPASALAERNVKYHYYQYNAQQHRIVRTWDVYTYDNKYVKSESSTSYGSHSFDKNNYCTKCGYYAGCPHSQTTQISSNVKTLPVNGTYHSTSGTVTVQCNSCKKQFTRDVDGKKEAHKLSGGKCTVCGFVVSQGAPKATEKPPCSHTFRESVLSRQYESRDASYHTAKELIQSKCSKCGYTQTKEVPRTEAHNMKDGTCKDCGLKIGCAHGNQQTSHTVIAAIDRKNGTHALQSIDMRTCAECAALLETRMAEEYQPHMFVSGICVSCGALISAQERNVDIQVSMLDITIFQSDIAVLSFEDRPGNAAPRLMGDAATAIENPPVNGFILPALNSPFLVDGMYVLREGEEAELYVILVDGGAVQGATEADAVSRSTPPADAAGMLDQFELSKVSSTLFDGWDVAGDIVSLTLPFVTGEKEGSTTIFMPEENEFSFVALNDTVSVLVVSGTDPRILFVADESFGQGMIPLLETEDGDLLISLEGLYYDKASNSLCGHVISRLPISLGAALFLGGDEGLLGQIGLSARWQGVQSASALTQDVHAADLEKDAYFTWPQDARGLVTDFSLPLDGAQAFWIEWLGMSGIAQCETYLNIAGTLFTNIPEIRDLLGADSPESIVDVKMAAIALYEQMEARFGQDWYAKEDSPLRALLQSLYQRDEAAIQAALAITEENRRQMQLSVACGSAANRFQTLADEMLALTNVDTLALFASEAPPDAAGFWSETKRLAISAMPVPLSPEEQEAVLAAMAAARVADLTWDMGKAVEGYVALEIYDPMAVEIP